MSAERKEKRARTRELQQLQDEIHTLQYTLDELYAQFDMVTDSAQVDACIYQLNAALSKYDYTIKCLKAFDFS